MTVAIIYFRSQVKGIQSLAATNEYHNMLSNEVKILIEEIYRETSSLQQS